MAANGVSFDSLARAHDRPIYATLEAAPAGNRRPVVVAEEIDVRAATLRAEAARPMAAPEQHWAT